MSRSDELITSDNMIETVLSNDVEFKGTLKFSKSLKIKGMFDGEIQADKGHLIIGEKAQIKATIKANNISNMGKIVGNLKALNTIEIYDGAMILGDISTKELVIKKGGVFDGHCSMNHSNHP